MSGKQKTPDAKKAPGAHLRQRPQQK